MQIQKQYTFSPNFQAIHIANSRNYVKNIETNIKIYELNAQSDRSFLKFLPKRINVENLMPNLSHQEYSRWNEMLEYAVDNSTRNNRKTILAVADNKPCGIAVFLPGKTNFHLDCICTWPIEYGLKVRLAGTTLFKHLFEIFKNSKATKISLEAITNGPYDTVSKYKELGFIECGGEGHKIYMETTTPKVKNTLKRLDNIIFTEKVDHSPKENLNEVLNLQI